MFYRGLNIAPFLKKTAVMGIAVMPNLLVLFVMAAACCLIGFLAGYSYRSRQPGRHSRR
jgi:hypothetical protein